MFYNQSSPWILKGLVVAVFFATRTPTMAMRMEVVMQQAMVPVVIQAAVLGPSLVCAVRERARTTRLISETALMVCLVCIVLYMGKTGRIQLMEVAGTLQMCTLHMFYQQGKEMLRGKGIVVGERVLSWVVLACSAGLPLSMVLATAGSLPGTKSMLLVLFSGEVMGAAASLGATVLAALADGYEASMVARVA